MEDREIKILIFAPYYLPHTYGITVCINEFARFISHKVKKITIFTPNVFENEPEREIIYGKVEIIRFPAFYLIFNYPFPKFWKLKTWKIFVSLIINRKEYNLVITTIRFFAITLFGAIFSKLFEIKLIHIEQVSNHSILSSKIKTFIAKLYDNLIGRLIFKLADVNVAPSTDVQKFINKFDKRRVAIIFNSLNTEDIAEVKPALEIKKKFENTVIICYPGRLCKWKGIEDSVELIKSLPDKIKRSIVYLIIGGGEDYSRIRNISKEEKSIVMMGELSRERTMAILKIADVYLHSVMPGGGLSNSILEAMYCGCAVVATPNEGAKDIIRDGSNGFLCYSKKDMTHKLIELIKNGDRRKIFGRRAKETVETKFTWEKSILEYIKLIKELMNYE